MSMLFQALSNNIKLGTMWNLESNLSAVLKAVKGSYLPDEAAGVHVGIRHSVKSQTCVPRSCRLVLKT